MNTLKTYDECIKKPCVIIAHCTDRQLLSDFYLKCLSISQYAIQQMNKKQSSNVVIKYSDEKDIKQNISNSKKLIEKFQLTLDKIKNKEKVNLKEDFIEYSKDQFVIDIRDLSESIKLLPEYYRNIILKNLSNNILFISNNEKYLVQEYKKG